MPKKSLIDLVIEDIRWNDGPLMSDEAFRDLLSVNSPTEITHLTVEEAIVLDRIKPTMLALECAPKPIHRQAMTMVKTAEGSSTVAKLMSQEKYPPDFILACLRVPDHVCRWYALEYLSERNAPWPEVYTEGSIDNIDTRFDPQYLFDSVHAYLRRDVDLAWVEIFGLEGLISLKNVTTTKDAIEAILSFLSLGSGIWVKCVEPQAGVREKIVETCDILGISTVVHYQQVRKTISTLDAVNDLVVSSVKPVEQSAAYDRISNLLKNRHV
jgi:hypothetical protein